MRVTAVALNDEPTLSIEEQAPNWMLDYVRKSCGMIVRHAVNIFQ
jgi:hypothetical protein